MEISISENKARLIFVYYWRILLHHCAHKENDEARIDALRLPLNKTTKGNRINFTPFLEPRDRFPRDESARAVRPDF